MLDNLSSTSPVAGSGFQLGKWQKETLTSDPSSRRNISVEVPNTGGVSVKTASYTATVADCGLILVFNSSSAVTLTLPTTAPFAQWQIAAQNMGAGTLSVVRGGSTTLDGSSSAVTLAQNAGIVVATDGSNYYSERGSFALPNVGTPGTYTKVTTDAQGRVASGTTLSASDIPAIAESQVTNLTTDLAAKAPSGVDVNSAGQVTATHLASPLPVAQGGTGTASPGIVAGANITVTGAWPNQTVAASAASGVTLKHDGTLNGSQTVLNAKSGSGISITDDGVGGLTWAVQNYSVPSLRGHASVSGSSASVLVSWPSGTQAGDLAIINIAHGWHLSATPTGWTLQLNAEPNTWWLCILTKTLTSTDITAGSVTVNFSNSFDYDASIVTCIGAPVIREVDSVSWAGSGPTWTLATSSAVISTDALITFGSVRAGSTITTSPGTSLETTSTSGPTAANTAAIGSPSAGANTVTWSYSGAGGGGIGSIVVLEAVSTGIGSVTSVGLAMPADFTVSGSPVTGAGTLTVTGGVTKSGVQQEAYTYGADTGSANAYAVTLSPAPTIVAGSTVCFKAANTCTGASTLAVNGGTATAITKNGTTALAAGDIAANQIIDATYDGTAWQILVPGTGGGSSITLTTTGSSGAATLTGSVLNIPVYSGSGSGGGGSLVLLEQHTASSSAELDFTSWYSSNYDEYVVELINVVNATTATALEMQFSTNGGTSYDTSTIYQWAQIYGLSQGGGGNGGSTAQAFFYVGTSSLDVSNTGWATGNSNNGTVKLFNPGGSRYKAALGQFTAKHSSDTAQSMVAWGGTYMNTTAVNAFRILASSGNLSSGTVRVYGVAKTIGSGGGSASLPLVAFTDPTAPTWTWVNQGSATKTTGAGVGGNNYLILADPGSATRNSRLLVKSIPSSPYTVTAAFSFLFPWQSATVQAGLVLRNSSSGNVIGFTNIQYSASTYLPYLGAYKQTSPTVFASAYREGVFYYAPPTLIWFCIKDDGTTRFFQYSMDGVQFVTFFSVGRTDYITPDQIGIYVDSNGSSAPVSMTLLSWKETTP